MIRNAGPGFQKYFADEPLLERLRLLVTDPLTDSEVKAKCSKLYRQWAALYKDTEGLSAIANLYKQFPQRKRPINKDNSRVLRETEAPEPEEEDEPKSRKASVSAGNVTQHADQRPSTAPVLHSASNSMSGGIFSLKHKKDKKSKSGIKAFSFEKEKAQMNQVITQAQIESNNLMNIMMLMDREKERISDRPDARRYFDACKQLRRQTYRWCSLVNDENYLSTLLKTNDQLSDVLVQYEQLDRSFDYDSDSEGDFEHRPASSEHKGKSPAHTDLHKEFTGFSLSPGKILAMPSRQAFTTTGPAGISTTARVDPDEPAEEEEDEDDPFADRNAVRTPRVEKGGMDW